MNYTHTVIMVSHAKINLHVQSVLGLAYNWGYNEINKSITHDNQYQLLYMYQSMIILIYKSYVTFLIFVLLFAHTQFQENLGVKFREF